MSGWSPIATFVVAVGLAGLIICLGLLALEFRDLLSSLKHVAHQDKAAAPRSG